MRNTFIILSLILINIIGYGQEKVLPKQVDETYVIALSTIPKGFKSTESIRIPDEILLKSESIEDRIHWVIKQSDVIAAMITRDGINFQIIREWDIQNQEIVTSAFFVKPVFFLSQPQKDYQVVKEHNIDEAYFTMSYYEIAKSFTDLYPNLDYDALVIQNNRVQYIKF